MAKSLKKQDSKKWNNECPLYQHFEFFGKKWTIFIIFLIGHQEKHAFNEILKSLSGLNSKVLAERLKELEDKGFIDRKIVSDRPIKIRYFLTEKGKDFDKMFAKVGKLVEKYEEK